MANLDSLIVCEDVQNIVENRNGTLNVRPQIIGPLDFISPYSVPGNYSFAIFGSISGIPEGVDSRLHIVINSPEGEELFKSEEMIVKKPDNRLASVKVSFNFRNFLFKEDGKYNIAVYFDENKIGDKDIYVQAQV